MSRTSLSGIIDQVPAHKRPIARQIVTELNFMQATLVKLRGEIKKNGVIEEFRNGKQEFQRESPALKSYNTTIARYATLHKQLAALLPDDAPEPDDELDEFMRVG